MASLSHAERIAALRERVAVMSGSAAPMRALAAEAPEKTLTNWDNLDIPWFPGGGLPRRAVSVMSDCSLLAVALITEVTKRKGFVAVVGWPELMFAYVVDSGGDLSRIITVPDPGVDALAIAAVLAEGMDLVVCYSHAPRQLTLTNARPLLAKVRKGSAAVLVVGIDVPSAQVHVVAQVRKVLGLGRGGGRIRQVEVSVEVRHKASAPQRTVVQCGEHGPQQVV